MFPLVDIGLLITLETFLLTNLYLLNGILLMLILPKSLLNLVILFMLTRPTMLISVNILKMALNGQSRNVWHAG